MSEVSNNFNHDNHLNYVIAPEAPSGSSNTPEDHHSTPNTAPTKEKWSLKRKVLTITGGIALAGTLGAGIGFAANSGNGRRAPEATTSSAPANSTPEASSTPQATSTPETQTNNPEFTGEVAEQTKTIEEMDALSVQDFAQLPYADRVAYAIAKNTSVVFYTTPDNDTIYNQPKYIPALWQEVDGAAINDSNPTEGAKIVSANQYYTTVLNTNQLDDSYKAASDSVLQNGGKGVMVGTKETYDDNGQWQTGQDRSGNPIDFIDVTSHTADSSTGNQTGEIKTDQVVRQQVKLLDGRTIVAYPKAYGVYGKKSPVDGGTY